MNKHELQQKIQINKRAIHLELQSKQLQSANQLDFRAPRILADKFYIFRCRLQSSFCHDPCSDLAAYSLTPLILVDSHV